MSVTLSDLLAESALGLSLVVSGDPGALDAPIVWVHSSESVDPTPYLEGGEMLLVTGLQWPEELPQEPQGLPQEREDAAPSRDARHLPGLQPADRQSFDAQTIAALRQYASRLADAGVRGIGFGIGVAHAAIPQWLVDECQQTGVPLLSVPLETPFIAISKRVARGVSDGRRQEFATL